MPIFTIDGNIGCGKSTVLEYLHTHYVLPIDLEPVKKWQPYLNDMYYHNKGACEFQIRVWLDRCWIQPKQDSVLIMERSPYFQKNVFIPINKENNRLSEREVNMLNEMYDKSSQIWNPCGYIYLRSNPDNCMKRIEKRSRESEESIDKKYIDRLHELHEGAYFWSVSNGYPMVCVDVENKTVAEIANNVYQILTFMGVSMNAGKYTYNNPNAYIHPNCNLNIVIDANSTNEINSFIAPHSFASFTPRPTVTTPANAKLTQTQTQELLNQQHFNQHKSVASRLIDISKAANNRRKHSLKSQPYQPNTHKNFNKNHCHQQQNQNQHQQMIEIPQYRVLTKTKTSTHTEMETETSGFSYEKAFTSEEDEGEEEHVECDAQVDLESK